MDRPSDRRTAIPATREARLAQALRANLRRRKGAPAPETAPAPASTDTPSPNDQDPD